MCNTLASKIAHQMILVAFQNNHATSAFLELPKGRSTKLKKRMFNRFTERIFFPLFTLDVLQSISLPRLEMLGSFQDSITKGFRQDIHQILQNCYGASIGEPSEIDSRVDEHLTDDSDGDIDAALWLRMLGEEAANTIDSDESTIKRSIEIHSLFFLFNLGERTVNG
jgi:hypothetical protein